MMNIKKIIAGALAIVCLFSTGCGSGGDTVAVETEIQSTTRPHITTVKTDNFFEGLAEDNSMAGAMPSATAAVAGGVTTDCCPTEKYYCPPPYPYPEHNTESYADIRENSYVKTADNAVSTFSADVDTASYSNIRRMIENNQAIDPDAVRIEEMLNYFSYDYNAPKDGEPFGVTTEFMDCPWNDEAKLMLVGLQAEEIEMSETPSNIVFLIDVSGSMSDPDKLPLVQTAFTMLAENLSEKDRISIVTYAGDDKVVLSGESGDNKAKIINAVYDLSAGGGTNGSAGIRTAYQLAEKHFIEGGNNRVILATDGDLNIGITDNDDLEDFISEKKESGVFLSVLGFGTGNIKDDKMEILADKGNGSYHYIDSVFEARRVLVDQMGSSLVTVAKDVKLQLEFNPEIVEKYRLIGYENRVMAAEDFDDDTKDGGEIGAGHRVTVLYEIVSKELDEDFIAYENEKIADLAIRYKEPDGNKSKLLEYSLGEDDIGGFSKNYDGLLRGGKNIEFAACVTEFGMILRDSKYISDRDCDGILSRLEDIDTDDDFRKEFVELVETYDEKEEFFRGLEEIYNRYE